MDLGKIYFEFKHKGFYRVFSVRPDVYSYSTPIGVCLRVKNATYHATWVFFSTKAFMAAQAEPYFRFCFGNSRKVAVCNFINGLHRVFQTGSDKPWLRSALSCSVAPSEEVTKNG